jgi:hypothetical protein
MTADILVGLLYAVLFTVLGWTFGQAAAYREHRRRQDRRLPGSIPYGAPRRDNRHCWWSSAVAS